jgi:hypothetical protein
MAITCLLHALRWYYADTVTYKQQPWHPQIYSITDWLERIGVSFKINDCLLETSAGYLQRMVFLPKLFNQSSSQCEVYSRFYYPEDLFKSKQERNVSIFR